MTSAIKLPLVTGGNIVLPKVEQKPIKLPIASRGAAGKNGVGIPAGGHDNQVIVKDGETPFSTKFVTLDRAMVGLSNVDNTSDLNKPLSNATQTALNTLQSQAYAYTDEQLNALFRDADFTVTVGDDGDYETVNDAIEALSRLKPIYKNNGFSAEIVLLSGFVMAEQVLIRSIDLSWITIKSEDAVVPIDVSAITAYLVPVGSEAYDDDLIPVFGGMENAHLPIIAALFEYEDQGDGYAAAPMDGVVVTHNSWALFKPGAGVNRARSGCKALYQSYATCYMPGLTQGGGGIGGGTITGVEFRYATRLAVHIGFGSKANFARSKLDHSKGSYGIYMIWGSHGDFYQSQVHDTINGNAITARDGSFANMRETNVARSERGYHALHNGRINARSSTNPSGLAVMWIGDAAKDCTGYGVLASYNSHIDAADLDVSGSATGVNASNASSISFIQGVALDCSTRGVSAVNASTIDAAGVKADNCDTGFYAENAAVINANPATVTGHATANNCTSYGFVSKAASTINADTSEATNAGIDAYYASETSIIQARNSLADDAIGYGFRCERSSTINARGSSAQRCVISYYSFECTGGGINAQSTNIDGSGTGYHVDRDGHINAGASIGTATTKSNITINSQSGKGTITDADVPWTGAVLSDSQVFTGVNKFAPTNGAGSFTITREDGTTGVMYVDTSSGTPRFVFGQGTSPGSLVNFNGKIYVGGGSGSATSFADFAASVAANASMRLRTGVDPTTPNDGDVWHTATEFKVHNGSTTESLAFKSEVAAKQDKTATWTVISSGVATAHTGTTTETVLKTITIPGGSLGPNGALRITVNLSHTNNANVKTARIRLGGLSGTVVSSPALANQIRTHIMSYVYNRNSESSQIMGTNPSTASSFGQSTSAPNTATKNTATDQDLVITAELADAGDTVTVESYVVEYHYQA